LSDLLALPALRLPPQVVSARKKFQQGHYQECLALCKRAIRAEPASHPILDLAAQTCLKLGKFEEAIGYLLKRAELDPKNDRVAEDLANLLMYGSRFEEALPHLERCIALRGWSEDLGYSLGFCYQETKNYPEALRAYQAVIQANPKSVAVFQRTALLFHDMGQGKQGIDLLDLALVINPGDSDLLYCQAKLLVYQGLLATALEKFETLTGEGSEKIEHLVDHAELLTRMRRVEAAREKFEKALQINPAHGRTLTCYAILLFSIRQYDEALILSRKILDKYPDDSTTLLNIGHILFAQRDFSAANTYYAKAYEVNPKGAEVAGSYLYSMSFVCDWTRHAEVLTTIEADTNFITSRTFPSVIYENNPAANLAYAERLVRKSFPSTNILGDLKPYTRKGKIRIGYYSADFYHHATAMLIEGLWREHDRDKFEIYAFSLGLPKPDEYSVRLRNLFDHFHDVSQLSDRAVSLLSRQLEIDIAIDLKGFTEGCRPSIFSERAAPIQLNFLGFPGSMGAPFIDYMVADRYTVFNGNREYFSEKIIYMPDCYQPNNPERPKPSFLSERPVELPSSKFVFCSFNNTYKLTPKIFTVWMRILRNASDSVLWMLKTTEEAERNLLIYAKEQGINPERIIFAPLVPEPDHLQRFVHADLFLDSFPCNAHTTASDALWAGVPIITRSGQTFASRVAGSILHAAGLPELIVDSEEAYEALALKIYRDHDYQLQLKQRVKESVALGPLYNAKTYTQHFELALIEVYERQSKGGRPSDLDVAQLRNTVLTL
jgi:predicted O-linked N-acetylglucosamine transferase (SPINDLY family)